MKLTHKQAKAFGLNPPRGKKQKSLAERGQKAAKECLFDDLCVAHDLPLPVHEYQFALPRKWAFDYLFDGWLALEVQGGLFTGGRHVRGAALLKEIEKLNEAALRGYTVIFCTPADIKSGAAFALVKRGLDSLGEQP